MDRIILMESYATVVKLGSYTRAAKELGVTRAMMSKRIQALETNLRVKLLARNTHGLSMTAAGADYYESCVPLLAEMRALDERMLDRRTAPRGQIKILSTKTFSETVLGSIITEFCGIYPELSVQITLVDRDSETYATHLAAGGYDLAVLTSPLGSSSLIARPLGSLSSTLVASPAYLARHGVPCSASDLIKHNCLDPSGAAHPIWELTGPSGRISVRVSGNIRTNGTLIIHRAALDGIGIALLREYLVRGNLRDGSLVGVLPAYVMDERKLYLVHHKDGYQPRRIKIFADHLSNRLRALADASEKRETTARQRPSARKKQDDLLEIRQ